LTLERTRKEADNNDDPEKKKHFSWISFTRRPLTVEELE
jgi:hypothetical protein